MMKLNIVQRTFLLVSFNSLFQLYYGVALFLLIQQQDVTDATKLVWTVTLATSMALSLLINTLFAWLFSRGLQIGLYTVHDNIKNLRLHRPLQSPLEGNDEIVDMDIDVHRLARSLGR
jgi:hypothetical protein